jgi:mono/diheme cytochrome c family protein
MWCRVPFRFRSALKLNNLHKSDGRIHEVITAGIKGEMPSFGKKLGDPDVRQLIAYLRTLHA